MALKNEIKLRLVNDTKAAFLRAGDLFNRIAINGASDNGTTYTPLMNPDRRDVATFIFFEVSAQYETFCREALKIEVRKKFSVEPKRAVNILGSSDKGLSGIMGWAAPSVIQNRAQNLFGKLGFFGRLEVILGQATYDVLTHAHKVRNRIAHGGPKAISDYNKILAQLGVPAGARKGLSVGRLLLDYPSGSVLGDRWFNRFLAAYVKVIDEYDRRMII